MNDHMAFRPTLRYEHEYSHNSRLFTSGNNYDVYYCNHIYIIIVLFLLIIVFVGLRTSIHYRRATQSVSSKLSIKHPRRRAVNSSVRDSGYAGILGS
jgi:hypothetical protein